MIQDIFPHKLDNQFHPDVKPESDSIILAFRGRDVLAKDGRFPIVSDFSSDVTDGLVYLFALDDARYFYLDADDEGVQIPSGFEFISVRSFRNIGAEQHDVFVAFTGFQLANWYRNNRFCGRCGKRTYLYDKAREIRCECGNVLYPRIVPAVIVGVTNGDKILVTKYRTGFAHYALVAGFTEIGETLEETVEREVMEEVGLRVKNIRYYKSQPWAIVDDILMGFYCDVDGDDTITMDQEELKIAEWRSRGDIILQPDNFSLTNEMMMMFKEGKT